MGQIFCYYRCNLFFSTIIDCYANWLSFLWIFHTGIYKLAASLAWIAGPEPYFIKPFFYAIPTCLQHWGSSAVICTGSSQSVALLRGSQLGFEGSLGIYFCALAHPHLGLVTCSEMLSLEIQNWGLGMEMRRLELGMEMRRLTWHHQFGVQLIYLTEEAPIADSNQLPFSSVGKGRLFLARFLVIFDFSFSLCGTGI